MLLMQGCSINLPAEFSLDTWAELIIMSTVDVSSRWPVFSRVCGEWLWWWGRLTVVVAVVGVDNDSVARWSVVWLDWGLEEDGESEHLEHSDDINDLADIFSRFHCLLCTWINLMWCVDLFNIKQINAHLFFLSHLMMMKKRKNKLHEWPSLFCCLLCESCQSVEQDQSMMRPTSVLVTS